MFHSSTWKKNKAYIAKFCSGKNNQCSIATAEPTILQELVEWTGQQNQIQALETPSPSRMVISRLWVLVLRGVMGIHLWPTLPAWRTHNTPSPPPTQHNTHNGRPRPFHGLVTPIKWTLRRSFGGVSAISLRRNRLYHAYNF